MVIIITLVRDHQQTNPLPCYLAGLTTGSYKHLRTDLPLELSANLFFAPGPIYFLSWTKGTKVHPQDIVWPAVCHVMTIVLACGVRSQNVVCARAPLPLGVFALLSMSHRFTASSPSSWSLLPLRHPLRQLSSPRAHGHTMADRALMALGFFLLVSSSAARLRDLCSSSAPPSSPSPCPPCSLAVARASAGRARRHPSPSLSPPL